VKYGGAYGDGRFFFLGWALLSGVIVWAFGSAFLSLVFDYIPFIDVVSVWGEQLYDYLYSKMTHRLGQLIL
jgi:hypothetical protein